MSDEQRFTVGTWSGFPNYECTLCPFSTLDRRTMEDHQRAHLMPPVRPIESLLFDAHGDAIEHVEIGEAIENTETEV